MTPDDILAAFEDFDYKLPEEAIRAAQAMPKTMAPLMLEELRAIYADYDGSPDGSEYVELYCLYLLAEFRDGRVLRILRDFLNRQSDEDGVFELPDGARKLFASWAWDDPFALWPFVATTDYDEFIRTEALGAFVTLYLNTRMTAEEMRPYLRKLGETVLVRDATNIDGWLWYTWAECCMFMGLSEFYTLIEEAIEKRWVDPNISDWEDERKLMAGTMSERMQKERLANMDVGGDTVEELRGWHCFTEAARLEDMKNGDADLIDYQDDYNDEALPVEDFFNVDTIVNETPKPKPNQPCPCGSGKKYKKCCARK